MSFRERKTAKRKEEIIRSAMSILAEKGYHGTTMEEIASTLLMTKGSVYYYFKDKQDLLFQGQEMLLEQSIKNVQAVQRQHLPVIEKVRRAVKVHIEYLISERSGFEMMLNPKQSFSTQQLEKILTLRNDYEKCFDQMIEEGIVRGEFVSSDIKVVRNIMLGAMNWVTQWYTVEGEKDQSEMAEDVSKYLLRILVKGGISNEH
ncbi:TetR/AcrR family transcriptional regulator [Shouchella shacheensis]|uniref:TetR/AcrR family transcriptional regulator n=1 Tax=Shouchella shacheensis TaxID=1649580 RepID=UPI0007403852|nr:TetR/AcrR family transcriptional regulator [Shouchella shacheensis]